MTSLEIKLSAGNTLIEEEIKHRLAHELDIFINVHSVAEQLDSFNSLFEVIIF